MEDPIDYVDQLLAVQPTRTGKTKTARRFDQTQLKSSHHGRYVHRDYAAHFFRWGWAARHIERGARILDVGCGQELPLLWVLSGNISLIPSYYLGVDLNKVEFGGSPKWAEVKDQFSFVDDWDKLEIRHLEGTDNTVEENGVITISQQAKFNYITNFEVIEHMQPEDGAKMLQGFRYWLHDEGCVYLSTPVFDGKAALNHCHEYTIPELQSLIEANGFEVEKRFGTFASAQVIKKAASKEDIAVWEKLAVYYGGDVLSTFLAPLYPDASRNNLWVLKKKSS